MPSGDVDHTNTLAKGKGYQMKLMSCPSRGDTKDVLAEDRFFELS
jgi:hypothetical protein